MQYLPPHERLYCTHSHSTYAVSTDEWLRDNNNSKIPYQELVIINPMMG